MEYVARGVLGGRLGRWYERQAAHSIDGLGALEQQPVRHGLPIGTEEPRV